jgi:hypothetical protein
MAAGYNPVPMTMIQDAKTIQTRPITLVRRLLFVVLLSGLIMLLLAACEPSAAYIVPTSLPTATATFTPSRTPTPGVDATPSPIPTQEIDPDVPTATPLLGPVNIVIATQAVTPTRSLNPNAPRIEFFTSDQLVVNPGSNITLYWSVLNVDRAVIYRLNADGERTQAYNVFADGDQVVQTRASDRGQIDFVLTANDGEVEALHTVLLRCPVEWFFVPAPDDCASGEPEETTIHDQQMERGRMIYVESRDVVYVLFNDGQEPGWLSFENRYDPEVHPERDENAPPEFIQPLRELGLIWRTDATVRTRLGLGIAEGVTFEGTIQTAPVGTSREILYISASDGTVLQLLPGNEQWQIIAQQ